MVSGPFRVRAVLAGLLGRERDAAESGHLVAIASNNAAEAITEYLVSRGLEALVAAIEGRRPDDPTRMKPDPDVLERALKRMGAQRSDALMIGDSVSDVRATLSNRVERRGTGWRRRWR